MIDHGEPKEEVRTPDVLIVRAGPIGLMTTIQIKRTKPNAHVLILEHRNAYARTQALKVKLSLMRDEVTKNRLMQLAEQKADGAEYNGRDKTFIEYSDSNFAERTGC